MDNNIINEMMNEPMESSILLRMSLKSFIKVFHYYLFQKEFIFKPFHDTIINALEKIAFQENEKTNLLVNVPVRSGKSQILQYFDAWTYTLNNQCNNIVTSYGNKLVERYSQFVKDLINTDLYKVLFTNVRLEEDAKAKEFWKIKGGGEFRASSMGGVITGFGYGVVETSTFGGCLVIDDPLKADNYKSVTEKENCIDYYVNTLKTRANNPKAPKVLIMQRLAQDDLSGYILENEADEWEYIKIPALDDEGNSFWDEKFPKEELEKLKKVHPYTFYSQYQQEPIIANGEVINPNWFGYYNISENYLYKKIIITADTALTVKESSDYTCFLVGGVTQQNKLHILDIVHGKWEYPELKQKAIEIYNKWQFDKRTTSASAFYIEDKASGVQLLQELKRCAIPVRPIEATKDKLTRVEEVLEYIASGQVLLPCSKTYSNNLEFLSECEAFTRDDSHKHDDQIDALVMLINNGIAHKKVSILDVL